MAGRFWAAIGVGLAFAAASPGLARTQAFVLMAPAGAIARAITDDDRCPALTVDGHSRTMAQRFAPATLPPRPSSSGSAEAHPSAFPIRVCEAPLPRHARRASVAGEPLPLPRAIAQRIVLIGDTGCRLKASSNAYQACNDPKHWPFARVARAAAAAKPDLVLHVGDYHYRENECPAGNAGCAGSPWGYGWEAWDADFFTPAAPLFAAAPWVVDRGNHEECARAGQGWWILLDPHPLVTGRDCVAAATDAVGDRAPPYAVELGERARLIVFDFAKIGEKAITDPATLAAYQSDAVAGSAMARAGDTNFMTDHYPFGAITETGKKGLRVGYPSVAGAFQSSTPLPPLPHVAAILSGHIHLLQVAAVKAFPVQIITGFSGTEEDEPPAPGTAAAAPALPDGLTLADLETRYGVFGFATLDRRPHGAWRFTARDWDGKPLLTRLIRRR